MQLGGRGKLVSACNSAGSSSDILQSFDGRSSDRHVRLLLTVGSVPLLPTARCPTPGSEVTDWAGAELVGNFGRTAGQDLQEMLILLLVDLAAGEPLRRDLLWRKLSQ
jgi:hypothetical protein